MPVAVQADKRFHRAHTKPVRRRHWNRLWVRILRDAIVAGVVAYAGYRGVRLVLHAPLLAINRIVVRGNAQLSTGEVVAILSGLRGQNLLDANLDVWRRRLLESTWVRDATLRRALPSTVEVTIVERRPIGIARIGQHLYLVDAQGGIIDSYGPNYGDLDLPIIDGLLGAPEDAEVDAERVGLAADLLAAMTAKRPDLAARISQIDVSDDRDAVVILSGDPARIELGQTHFVRRLESYLQVAPALREKVPAIDYVDLRFGPRIFVHPAEPAKGSDRGPTGPRP
ncbi:MAG TPA: FtsQ-type POTRA domain-containing protein [Vicinamibacterales bacterium]|nr:FtsQ-type POTRA domain-containing protein [Vicinamibacterales bacterium]